MLWLIYLVAAILGLIATVLSFYAFDAIFDFNADFIDPRKCCKSLNSMVADGFFIQLALTLGFIWQPWFFLWNLAVLFFLGWQMARRGGRLPSWWTIYDPKRIQKNERARWLWWVKLMELSYYIMSTLTYCIMFIYSCFN